MKDMQLTKAETKKRESEYAPVKGSAKGPDYPYGLALDLDHETLAKLGVKGAPKAGTPFTIHAKGHVRSSSSDTNARDKGPRHRASVQITHMALGKGPSTVSRADASDAKPAGKSVKPSTVKRVKPTGKAAGKAKGDADADDR